MIFISAETRSGHYMEKSLFECTHQLFILEQSAALTQFLMALLQQLSIIRARCKRAVTQFIRHA